MGERQKWTTDMIVDAMEVDSLGLRVHWGAGKWGGRELTSYCGAMLVFLGHPL